MPKRWAACDWSCFARLDTNDTTIDSARCLVIVGYDDKRHALKLCNSWGSEWADKGPHWLAQHGDE